MHMHTRTIFNIIRWFPRVLGILSILFISIFALDAFGEGIPIGQALLGFAIHLLPSAILSVLLAVAWRAPKMGGILFVLVSFLPFFLLSNELWVNFILTTPLFLTGISFLFSSFRTREGER